MLDYSCLYKIAAPQEPRKEYPGLSTRPSYEQLYYAFANAETGHDKSSEASWVRTKGNADAYGPVQMKHVLLKDILFSRPHLTRNTKKLVKYYNGPILRNYNGFNAYLKGKNKDKKYGPGGRGEELNAEYRDAYKQLAIEGLRIKDFDRRRIADKKYTANVQAWLASHPEHKNITIPQRPASTPDQYVDGMMQMWRGVGQKVDNGYHNRFYDSLRLRYPELFVDYVPPQKKSLTTPGVIRQSKVMPSTMSGATPPPPEPRVEIPVSNYRGIYK